LRFYFMAITKKPSHIQPALSERPMAGLPAKLPLAEQMEAALQKFIAAAPDGVSAKPAAPATDSVKLSLRIRTEDLVALDQAARRQGLSRSAFIKRAVMLQRDTALAAPQARAPETAAAAGDAGQRLRRQLAETLAAHLTRLQLSQAEAAALCGVSQPRISELLRGAPIGLEALVNMASAAGLQVDLRVLAEV
jgi:predicted XRE-type DNA-binding protein